MSALMTVIFLGSASLVGLLFAISAEAWGIAGMICCFAGGMIVGIVVQHPGKLL